MTIDGAVLGAGVGLLLFLFLLEGIATSRHRQGRKRMTQEEMVGIGMAVILGAALIGAVAG